MIEYASILNSLPQLKRSQLEDIRRRCAFLLQNTSTSNTQVMEEEDWVLRGILREIERRGLEVHPGFRIKKMGSFASFATKSERVRELLEKTVPNISLTQRRYLGELSAYCLCDYVVWKGFSKDVSLSVLLERVDFIPHALERSFPGYLEAGALGTVLRS